MLKKSITLISILLSFQSFSLTIDELEKKANSGDAESQYRMGLAYEFGKGGLPYDELTAERWYKKSKTDKAYSRLAVINYEDGNIKLAKKYLNQPLQNKFPFAFLYMGKIMLDEGNQEGKKYIKYAALKGVPEAMFLFGQEFLNKGDDLNAYIYIQSSSIKKHKPAKSVAIKIKRDMTPTQVKVANKKIRELTKKKD